MLSVGSVAATDKGQGKPAAIDSWTTLDANANGSLSVEEVVGTRWEQRFDAMDRNGDDKVSKKEFDEYLRQHKRS